MEAVMRESLLGAFGAAGLRSRVGQAVVDFTLVALFVNMSMRYLL